MNLLELITITITIASAEPDEGPRKIPWDDHAFSARMLREHLTQEHDLASRRAETIDRHVAWIHAEILGGTPSAILDLGCGPGLYTSRLARLGHRCVGIDFGPASIEHAQREAKREGLACEYHLRDLRDGFEGPYDLVMLIFGELNTFPRDEALAILSNARAALAPGGSLVLEVATEETARGCGRAPDTWSAAASGLFSDRPYLCLKRCAWIEAERASLEQFFIVDAETATVERYGSTLYADDAGEYREMLHATGFETVTEHPSLEGRRETAPIEFMVLVARCGT